jgi:hypothetical protein
MAFAQRRFQGAAAGAAAPRQSKYAGVKAAAPRYPRPQPGSYRFRIVETFETDPIPGKDPYFVATLEVVSADNAAHPVGSCVHFDQCVSTKAMGAGGPRIKLFVMMAVGCDDEGAYDAEDPSGALIDAVANQIHPGNKWSPNPLAGRLIDAFVTAGATTRDGTDFYRNFDWAIVPEELQEVQINTPE